MDHEEVGRYWDDNAEVWTELVRAGYYHYRDGLNTPAFLVGADGELLFYNEAAGALLGSSFEESGRMTASEWGSAFGPFNS